VSAVTDDAWIRRFQPAPDAPVILLCLPHAGGSANFYQSMANRFGRAVDVVAVQYPGRHDRRLETPVDDLLRLAGGIVAAVGPWLDRPVALFGHSMGATLGFEVARRMEASGRSPVHLFASGRRAPSCLHPSTLRVDDDSALLAELRRLSGTDTALLDDPEIQQMILPAVRADYKAIHRYRCLPPDARLRCPVTALVGDADPQTTLDEAAAWARHTSATFDRRVFPGDHFFLKPCEERVVAAVLARLTAETAVPGPGLRT
jgi:surfactin synthase thioesterase subunit